MEARVPAFGVWTRGGTLPRGAPLFQRDAAVAVDVDLREDLVHQRVHLVVAAVEEE